MSTRTAVIGVSLSLTALALARPECSLGAGPPGRVAGDTELGWTRAAHSLTRGHNRKLIQDVDSGRWYIFWLRDDGNAEFHKDAEGVVYQSSTDGLKWTDPVVVEPLQNGGITAWDVIQVGKRFYLLGLTDDPNASGRVSKYGVRELAIQPAGGLEVGPPRIVYDNSDGNSTSVHFYGSLLHDAQGHFWVAARVGDSSPNTHADVIRSTKPESIAAWGPRGTAGKACNDQWTDPYAASGRKLLQGTIASRLIELGPHGIGLVTYNKDDAGAATRPAGQILFVRNASRTQDGWEPNCLVLTDRANQYIRLGSAPGADRTRLDDRRFAALADPATHVIHVAYIAADANGPDNANLRYFTLSPPYTMAQKSAESTAFAGEADGVHISIDMRTSPATIYLFYVANHFPNYRIRMVRGTGKEWSTPLDITDGASVVRYPQSPEKIDKDEFVVCYQRSEKVPGGLVYHIRAAKVILAPRSE